jgi:hypothetical protein
MKNVIKKLGLGLSSLLIVTAFAGTAHALPPPPPGVPEVDPGSMGAAMALLVGGYLVVVSKLRRK